MRGIRVQGMEASKGIKED